MAESKDRNVIDRNIEGRPAEQETIRKEVRGSGKAAGHIGNSNVNHV